MEYDPDDPIGIGNLPTLPARTFDASGREIDPHELINAQALVSRLQSHALGDKSVRMDSTEIAAASRLLERVMVRAEARAPEPPPASARIVMPSDVTDDDALAAYLAMIG